MPKFDNARVIPDMAPLYGDGIHDDTSAIQERIDNAGCELALPAPAVCYLISRPLELPSKFKLSLPRYAEIRLAANSNCLMLTNKSVPRHTPLERKPNSLYPLDKLTEVGSTKYRLFGFVAERSDTPEDASHDIEVQGGIWNYNNMEQALNPLHWNTLNFQPDESIPNNYGGVAMLFYNVTGLTLHDLTLKDTVTFALMLDQVSYFTVSDITFDINMGNPYPWNTDGVHLDGKCAFGVIRNFKGACYDDLVALNADEGSDGAIHDITIDGLYAEDCHSAVRLLTYNNPLERVHITNVHGTYFQYCIGLTGAAGDGYFDAISIDHVFASKAERYDRYGLNGNPILSDSYAFIHIFDGVEVRYLRLSELHRQEKTVPAPTFLIGKGATIRRLILDGVTVENQVGGSIPLFENNGEIEQLQMQNVWNL